MNIVINDDLTSVTISEDELYECILPSYNPSTLNPFSSEEEVREFATKFTQSNPFAWSLRISDEEKAARATANAKFQNITRAKQELAVSDWADLPSVRNVNNQPHLTNGAEFDAYRTGLRSIIANKLSVVEVWAEAPNAVWSTNETP